MVWRLDRLGRSLPHLLQVVTDLEERGIGFRSVTESIDTTTAGGKLIFSIFGALAEFERNLIRERTSAGLAAARARGRVGGAAAEDDAEEDQAGQVDARQRDESDRNRGDPRSRPHDAVSPSEVVVPHRHFRKGVTSMRMVYEPEPIEMAGVS